ncbi:hypothetical protein CY35_02G120800 [Sphagnum magellanicum]|nr:hypothetical protein CY35_02G120800 [Sphagnum magellanicum]
MGRSYMLLIANPSMSLAVALLQMTFMSNVLSQIEANCPVVYNTSNAEANAVKDLYTGLGIMRRYQCSDPCRCGWQGVSCSLQVVQSTAPGSCPVNMQLVTYLELDGLGLRGNLSGAIGNLTNLQTLTITGNPGLTGNLPSEIGSLTNLTFLTITGNPGLIGNLPSEIGNLSQLVYLNITGNPGLTGNLPSEIGSLTILDCLIITGSPGLTGNLPSEIGSLSRLIYLDLHDNNFTGVIPNLASLGNLNTLTLNGNAFSGSIEHVFDGLLASFPYSGISRVDLSSNQLTGCIPGLTTGLGNWSSFPPIQYL